MPPHLPSPLLQRLTPEENAAVNRAIDGIGLELAATYAADVADHREARGDNAQLFGLKVWVHGRHRIVNRFDEDAEVLVRESNGSYTVEVGPFSAGVYKLGDFPDEDIHACFPDASPTKRGYGERNRAQLSLFDATPSSRLAPDARYACNDLIVGHFGNPRDGLVKWYVGAYIVDEVGRPSWAWVARQKLPGVDAAPVRTRPPVVPFNAREAEPLEVRARRDSAQGE